MKETPNVYRALKWLSQAYEERKRTFAKRREAGEINRDTEFALVQELDYKLKYELDCVIGKIDDGELDGEAEAVAEPEDSESAEVAING